MTEMEKRVAEAIAEEVRLQHIAPSVWSGVFGSEVPRTDMARIARAAIAAMREPTADMQFMAGSVELIELSFPLGADNRPHGNPALTMDQASEVWAAMIDAALGTKP